MPSTMLLMAALTAQIPGTTPVSSARAATPRTRAKKIWSKVTAYFCDAAYFPAYRDLKEELFPEQPPASTGIIVAGLLHPDFMMEIDATAVIGAGS